MKNIIYSNKYAERRRKNSSVSPIRIVVLSFLMVILTGTMLLHLPIATKDGSISFIDALFTATSATCVTGLIVFDTYSKFTVFGQAVILAMIQIGGLGLVTFTTFFSIIVGKKLGFKTLKVASNSSSIDNVAEIASMMKTILIVAFTCEFIGFLCLSLVMVPKYGIAQGLWISLFTAISAFCNAGFDIFGFISPYTSLTTYANNVWVNLVIMLLIISGGLGFMVWSEIKNAKKVKQLSFHSRIVLITTAGFIVFGTLAFLILEWNNPKTLGNMPVWEKVLASAFQSVTCRTAGFNTIDQNGMTGLSKIFSSFLMFVGAAPGGTGGGIKITTFTVILVTIASVIRGRSDAIFLNRKINQYTVYKSLSIITIALLAVSCTSIIVYHTSSGEVATGINCVYESFSAFATVGLTTGVTLVMSTVGKIFTIISMFLGRVGPVSLAISLSLSYNDFSKREICPDGKIIVG